MWHGARQFHGLRGYTREICMKEMLWFTLRRWSFLPIAIICAEISLFMWKFFDPRYLGLAKWVAETILVPLHHITAAVVSRFFPVAETLIKNTEPSHHDAQRIIYPILIGLFTLFWTLVWFGVKALWSRVKAQQLEPVEVFEPKLPSSPPTFVLDAEATTLPVPPPPARPVPPPPNVEPVVPGERLQDRIRRQTGTSD